MGHLPGSVGGYTTLDLGVANSSPTVSIEITFKKLKKEKISCRHILTDRNKTQNQELSKKKVNILKS